MRARVFAFLTPLAGLCLLATFACSGCGEPTKQTEEFYEIGVGYDDGLCRSLSTAQSFQGHLIKTHIEPGRYAVVGREIHVPGTVPGSPPLIVFRLSAAGTPPDPKRPVKVVGRVQSVTHDRVWRTRRADYGVLVTDCLAANF